MNNDRVDAEQIREEWQELQSLTPKEWRGRMISIENRLNRLLRGDRSTVECQSYSYTESECESVIIQTNGDNQ